MRSSSSRVLSSLPGRAVAGFEWSRGTSASMTPLIVGLGEILWDVFPDGPRFGGAPANTACSAAELAGSAARVVMVSGVGDDELGDAALAALASHGVDGAGVQRNHWPTGRVDVTLDSAGMASYRFADDSAWDHLAWSEPLSGLAGQTAAVCFGTLGQRHADARGIIRRFVSAVPESALRVLDVNLRPPFDDDQVILTSLELCNVLKLNDEELPRVARVAGCEGDTLDVVRQLSARYGLRAIAITRSASGAMLLCGSSLSALPGRPVTVADTVGAGDAYTAAMILGLVAGHDVEAINTWAIAVASHACSVPGGTMAFPEALRVHEG